MKWILLALVFAGCAPREIIKTEIRKVPVIQREEAIIVVPVPVPMKPPTMQRAPSEYWA